MTRFHIDRTTAGALITSALASVLLVYVGTRETVNYDSIWNVFIARQDQWRNLWREVGANPNPPLYHVLLRISASVFGSSPLAYRLLSILGIAASTVLVAPIVKRLVGSTPLAVAAAAAFGFSSTALVLALEVRAYALELALMLAAFLLFLSWIATDAAEVPAWNRWLLTLILAAAPLTHYSAGFLLGGIGLTIAVLVTCHARWRRRLRQEVREHPLSAIAMIVVPLLVSMAVFAVHLRFWAGAGRLNHVPAFLFDPASESAGTFLSRTLTALVVLVSPATPAPTPVVLIVAVVLFAALLGLAARSTLRGETAGIAMLFLSSMLALNIVAALAGRYPLGGLLRHQSFLFAFLIVAVFAGSESARQLAPRRWATAGAWVAILAVAIGLNLAAWLRSCRINTTPLIAAEMQEFRDHFGQPDALFVDQYNFIYVFAQYHDATWRLRSQQKGGGLRQVWDVTRGSERISVCREWAWQADLAKPSLYGDVAACLERTGAARVGWLRMQQFSVAATDVATDSSSTAVRLAGEAGLVVDTKVEGNGNVFAAFERRDTRP